MKATRPSPRKN